MQYFKNMKMRGYLRLKFRDHVLVDYADETMTTRTPTAYFEGFSQTLKKQSCEEKDVENLRVERETYP